MIPDQVIETIRSRVDIVSVVSEYLTLKKAGQNFMGLCPFHSEKTASFTVNPTKQFFHCFGCSAGGDLFAFVSKIEQISFPEAVRRFAEKTGVTIPDQKESLGQVDSESEHILNLNEAAAQFFHQNLMEQPGAEEARAYLKERGISVETMKAFSIGFAMPRRDDLIRHLKKASLALLEKGCLIKKGENGYYDHFRNRIIFPIKTTQGRVVGFGGRVLDQSMPKYLNTSETPVFTKGRQLFGLHLARGKNELIVVEGYFDVISLYQAGIHHVVATLGTALTADHLQLLRRFSEKVHVVFDPDRAGLSAALRAAPLFLEKEIAAEVVSLPTGQDPDLFVRTHGPDSFLAKLTEGQSMIDFIITQTARSVGSSILDRTKAVKELFPLMHRVTNKVSQGHYLKGMADLFGLEERDLRSDFIRDPKPMAQAITASRPVEKKRIPPDEKTLLALLIQDQLDLSLLEGIVPNDFTTPEIKRLIERFWTAETESWTRLDLIRTPLEEAERILYTELAVLEIPDENRAKIKEDCIRSIHKKQIERKRLKVQMELKLAEKEGNPILVASLGQTFFNLKKELSQIA